MFNDEPSLYPQSFLEQGNKFEVYNYKRFILMSRDFKKGKELLEDAVCHRVITQKEYEYLTGYTDGLRDGGKQNV